MSDEPTPGIPAIFDQETWADLTAVLAKLPEPLSINVWGDPSASYAEKEAAILCRTLSDRFDPIHYRPLPRRLNYPYYPVIGVMRETDGEEVDLGVRLIGLPSGYQMTALLTAIQAVSFKGATLEPITRIKLHKLVGDSGEEFTFELMTSAEDEGGPLIAKMIFGMAVANDHVRSFLIMSDMFPEANLRYSVNKLPHTVINGRVHVEGVVDEAEMLRQMSKALGNR